MKRLRQTIKSSALSLCFVHIFDQTVYIYIFISIYTYIYIVNHLKHHVLCSFSPVHHCHILPAFPNHIPYHFLVVRFKTRCETAGKAILVQSAGVGNRIEPIEMSPNCFGFHFWKLPISYIMKACRIYQIYILHITTNSVLSLALLLLSVVQGVSTRIPHIAVQRGHQSMFLTLSIFLNVSF